MTPELPAGPLRVAVDGRSLGDGSQTRGAGVYLHEVLAGLARAADVRPVVVATSGGAVPDGVDHQPLRPVPVPARLRGMAWDLALPKAMQATRADVWFSPGQHPPRRSTAPVVQTLLDVIPLEHPHPSMRRDRWRWRLFAPRFRGATRVVAISRHSADAGIRHLGLDPARVEVVHLAAGEAFRPAEDPLARPEQPYLLFVGAWGPHKGLAEACAVVSTLADAGHPHRLHVVGPGDDWMRAHVAEVVAGSARPERIDQVGYAEDLVAQYQGADALVVTSRCEGFCLPAVEAMACGTPVVAFANSALPEVIDGGGTLVADGDVASMVAELRHLLGSALARAEASERAITRAASFDWGRTVESHVDILREAAGR